MNGGCGMLSGGNAGIVKSGIDLFVSGISLIDCSEVGIPCMILAICLWEGASLY